MNKGWKMRKKNKKGSQKKLPNAKNNSKNDNK